MLCGKLCHFIHINCSTENLLHGSYTFIHYAAWHNHLEIAQIGVDVESKAVTGNPASNSHTDGGNLFITNPDAGQPFYALARNAILGNHANQNFFNITHITMDITTIRFQIDNRIAYKLPVSV